MMTKETQFAPVKPIGRTEAQWHYLCVGLNKIRIAQSTTPGQFIILEIARKLWDSDCGYASIESFAKALREAWAKVNEVKSPKDA